MEECRALLILGLEILDGPPRALRIVEMGSMNANMNGNRYRKNYYYPQFLIVSINHNLYDHCNWTLIVARVYLQYGLRTVHSMKGNRLNFSCITIVGPCPKKITRLITDDTRFKHMSLTCLHNDISRESVVITI